MLHNIKKFLIACCIIFAYSNCQAKELNVLVTITPIYSLVKNVTGDLQNVQLLIDKNMCPHDYQMRPSDVRKINRADLIITVGEGFEVFLFNYLNKAHINAEIKKLVKINNLTLLPASDSFQNNTHAHHHDHDHDHDHTCNHDHSHKHLHYDDNVEFDWNFWPSPKNAKAIVKWVAKELSSKDPTNAKIYSQNAKKTIARITKLDSKIRKKLTPVKNKNFIVLNDYYQYIEKEYGLSNVGAIVIDKNFGYSAKRIDGIKKIVNKKHANCIFVELHTPRELVKKIEYITGAKVAYVDIEWGRSNENITDKDVYFSMMEQNAQNITECLLHKQK
ncbi:MAG: zinc ABC transporter substrate-binding protein [Rickettsiales bacterium]|nr:zinc ABC transporter substrate-binding protein [Rickettsiales bacterium]